MTPDMRCKHCAYWEEEAMVCTKADHKRNGDSSGFSLVHYQSDDAWLETGPDFGCVKFVTKKGQVTR